MKWLVFLGKNDIKSVKQTTLNHVICSVLFEGRLGYCKAAPFLAAHNDPVMADQFNRSVTKWKAPRSRSSSEQKTR